MAYIQKVNAQLGHYVNKGDVLFTIKTKEAKVLAIPLMFWTPALNFRA